MFKKPLHPPLILLAEDNAIVRRAGNHCLSSMGYKVIEACDGEEAITILCNHPIALIIADLRIPKADGMEILQTVMRDQPCIPGHHRLGSRFHGGYY